MNLSPFDRDDLRSLLNFDMARMLAERRQRGDTDGGYPFVLGYLSQAVKSAKPALTRVLQYREPTKLQRYAELREMLPDCVLNSVDAAMLNGGELDCDCGQPLGSVEELEAGQCEDCQRDNECEACGNAMTCAACAM